jgi:hypothetical protein
LSRSTSLAARRTSWKPVMLTSVVILWAMHTTLHTYQMTAARTARWGSRSCLASYCRSSSQPSLKLGSPAASSFRGSAPPAPWQQHSITRHWYCIDFCNKMMLGIYDSYAVSHA